MTDDPDEELETDPASWASPDPDEHPETIVDPEELDIGDADAVRETDDGRYVVSTDGSAIDPDLPPVAEGDATESSGDESNASDAPRADGEAGEENDDASSGGGTASAEPDHLAALERELADNSTRHALAVAVRDGERVRSLRAGGDPGEALAAVLRTYARTVEPDRPPAETLATVLSDTPFVPDE